MVELKTVSRDAPWRWLRAGWADFMQDPLLSLLYGLLFVGIGFGLVGGLWILGWSAAAPVALGGFALVAPVFALGLYQKSRAIDRGEPPRLRFDMSRHSGRRAQLGFASLLLLVLFFLWARAAQFLFAIYSMSAPIEMGGFVEFALTTPSGLSFLVIGTLIGAVLAVLAFSISVLTFPMLIDQDVDAVTAMMGSIKAVTSQPFVLFTWAWIIAFMVVAGIAFFGIGLAVTFPWIAHASWRAYQDLAPKPLIAPVIETGESSS